MEDIRDRWLSAVRQCAPLYREGSFHVLVGDGVKQSKEVRELKQQVGAFCCHFWSKHMPKLSYYQKKGDPAPLERVEDEKTKEKILKAVHAIEMHMALSCIAMGILQSLSILFIGKVSSSQIRCQRTPSSGRVSEAAIMHYFRKHFFRLLEQKPGLCITQIIHGLQKASEEHWDSLAA